MPSQDFTLYIKLADDIPDFLREYYNNYYSRYTDDSGFDLPTKQEYKVINGKSTGLEFGISCCMVDSNGNPVGYYLYPRSSFHKYPLIVANHVGIIDAGYRGPIKGMVKNLYYNGDFKEYTVDKNLKLFQICSPNLSPFKIKITNSLPDSNRGSNGFGSTGN